MSIETEITRISTNVSDTLSAVSEMGGEVPEGATSNDMAAGVRSIPVGAKIDDTTPSSTTVYSSQKIESVVSELNQANAAQDKVIAAKANDTDLAAVAKSGKYEDLSGKPDIPTVPSALKNPNKLKLTGAVTAEYDGSSEVSVEIPGGGNDYTLPVATETALGGVKPAAKTDEMTQEIGVDAEGKLWGPTSGGGEAEWILLKSETLAEDVSSLYLNNSTPVNELLFVIAGRMNNAEDTLTTGNASLAFRPIFNGSISATWFISMTVTKRQANFYSYAHFKYIHNQLRAEASTNPGYGALFTGTSCTNAAWNNPEKNFTGVYLCNSESLYIKAGSTLEVYVR